LRVKDLDFETRILTVSRTVMELSRKFHPTGGGFLVKEYPKDKEYRRLKLSQQIVDKLKAHIEAERLGDGDLFFAYRDDGQPHARPRVEVDPAELVQQHLEISVWWRLGREVATAVIMWVCWNHTIGGGRAANCSRR
jgi:integrase